MADELSALNFSQDLQEAMQVEDAQRWKVEPVGALEVFLTLSPENAPNESFQARLAWNVYPGEPPSIKFRDPESGSLTTKTAWPIIRGFRPDNLDTCVNYSSEGFVTHPEWKNDPNLKWNPNGNVILKIFRTLQSEMDNHFSGRFKQ